MSAEIYRAFDADGRLLYVGSSVNVEGRLRYHWAHSPWWPFHTEVTRTRYSTLAAARLAEIEAIQTEHPRWNVAHRSPEHPDGAITMARGRFSCSWLLDEIEQWREHLRARRAVV